MSSFTLAATDGGPVELGATMWSIYQSGPEKYPNHPAIIVEHQEQKYLESLVGPSESQSPAQCLSWSYEQLRRGASRLAATFQAKGVLPGSIIGVFITNSVEWALLTWTAAIGRYSLGLFDPRAVEPARVEELTYFIKTLNPALIVVDNGQGIEAIEKIAQQLSINFKLGICRDVDQKTSDQWVSFEDLAKENYGEAIAPLSDDLGRIATYMFTSGTSVGHPKGVPKTVESWLACATTKCMQPTRQNTIASLTTLIFRIAANTLSLAIWRSGGTLIIPSEQFDGEKYIDAVAKYQINYIQPVFHLLFPLVENKAYTPEKVRSITHGLMGGDVITTQQLVQWKEYFPNLDLAAYYGSTEGTGITGWSNGVPPNTLPVLDNIVASGKAAPGTKLRVVDDEGKIVQCGEKGELHVGGQVIASKYLDNIQPENFYTDREGSWMKTGDTAIIDQDGNLFVLGRTKDIIKRKGVPISPSSIESCLREHGHVVAQLVGVPSKKYGEEAYAIVEELPDDISVEKLQEMVISMFGAEFALSGVVSLSEIGMTSWPKSSADKILKKDLRKAVMAYLSVYDSQL